MPRRYKNNLILTSIFPKIIIKEIKKSSSFCLDHREQMLRSAFLTLKTCFVNVFLRLVRARFLVVLDNRYIFASIFYKN